MKVVIKALKGGEDTLEVKDGSVTVKELKASYESLKNVKISSSDKLLFKGKSLNDSNSLDSYNIKDGDKLHFIATAAGSTGIPKGAQVPFWDRMKTFLLKHFTEDDSVKIIQCMQLDLRTWINESSLEMIEATAAKNLEVAKPK